MAQPQDLTPYLLSEEPPATLLGDFLPASIAEGVDDALENENVMKMLEMCFDPETFPTEDFDFQALRETIRRKIANAPDNQLLELPELGDGQIGYSEGLPTPETDVENLSFLLSAPQKVMLHYPSQLQLQQQAMFLGSQDPFLGNQSLDQQTMGHLLDLSTMPMEVFYPGSVCVGSWNSPQLGNCHLFAVPCYTSFEEVHGAIMVGFLKGRPVWFLPQ